MISGLMVQNKTLSRVYHNGREILCKRKFRILAAVLFFLVEIFLLAGPLRILEEDKVNFLGGQGSWALENQGNEFSCCQEFRPEYDRLESIGIVIADEENWTRGGEAVVTISDSKNEVLFETEVSYEQLSKGYGGKIETNIKFPSLRQNYYLNICLRADEDGKVPSLKVCGTEYYMPENVALRQNGELLPNTQLLTMYTYRNGISESKIRNAFLICAVTAFGIAFGIPKDRRLRNIAGVCLLIAAPYILGRRLELISISGERLLPFAMKWNVGLMYLLELLLLLYSCSIRFSVCASNLLLTMLYTASYYIQEFRGRPLRWSDFSAVGTALRVMGNYELRPSGHLAMAWGILLVFLIYGAQTSGPQKIKTGKRMVVRCASLVLGIIITIVSGYELLYTDMLFDKGFVNTQFSNYDFNGYLVSSFIDLQKSRIAEPDGYSVEKVENLLEKEKETEDNPAVWENREKPHIIMVMNESFSDLRVLGNLEISQENMTFFNSLEENTVRGYVNASVIGGGTANSEFEIFTGSSMGFLPESYYAYQQCMVKEMPSMISDLKGQGYTVWSIHPEQKINWSRSWVYRYLGLDHNLWIEDFPDAETLHAGVSDLETYKKVEEIFENREKDEKLFIFNLTMQNHGGYTESDVERSVEALNVSYEDVNIYLSLIKESDEAFEQLIAYFEAVDEPVVICMFGDHQPKLQDSFYEEIYSKTEGLKEEDKVMNQYKTPFVIWANYDIEEQEGLDIGMGYLGALLMKTADVPASPYFSFLQDYMKEYPIITINGYEDSAGNFYNWSGENNELPEYRMLQYNHIFDDDIVEWGY